MPDLNNFREFRTNYAGRELIVEVGKYAEQANGACLVRCGETVVHVSVCMSETVFFGRGTGEICISGGRGTQFGRAGAGNV